MPNLNQGPGMGYEQEASNINAVVPKLTFPPQRVRQTHSYPERKPRLLLPGLLSLISYATHSLHSYLLSIYSIKHYWLSTGSTHPVPDANETWRN